MDNLIKEARKHKSAGEFKMAIEKLNERFIKGEIADADARATRKMTSPIKHLADEVAFSKMKSLGFNLKSSLLSTIGFNLEPKGINLIDFYNQA